MRCADSENFLPDLADLGLIATGIDDIAHPAGKLHRLLFAKTARGDRRGAHTDAGGHEWRLRVIWNGILVDRDVRPAQSGVPGVRFESRKAVTSEPTLPASTKTAPVAPAPGLGAAAFASLAIAVALPLLKPVLIVTLLFRTVDALRVFDVIFVLTGGGPGGSTNAMSLFAYTYYAAGDFGYGLLNLLH